LITNIPEGGKIFKEFIRFLYVGLDLEFEPKLRHCKICVQYVNHRSCRISTAKGRR